MISRPLFAVRPWPGVLAVVLLGMSASPANAHEPGVSGMEAPPPSTETLPPTLTALRVEILVPRRPSARPSSSRDRWWARDKARHVVFSGLWTLSTQYVLVRKADWSEGDALPVSMATSGTVGLAKELYDASRSGGRASGKDLVANAVGIGLAVGVILL